MRFDATEKLLNAARRRLWLQALIARLWLGLMLTSCILGVAAILHSVHMPLTMIWWGTVALLPFAVASITTVFNRPSLAASARATDHWLKSCDLLTSAYYLRSQSPCAKSTAGLVVLGQAEQLAINAPRSLPQTRQSRHPLPTVIAVAVAATSLFFLSLQGAIPDDRPPVEVLNLSPALDHASEDNWSLQPESSLSDVSEVIKTTQPLRGPSSRSPGLSNKPLQQASPASEDNGSGDPGSSTRPRTLQASEGVAAGRVATMQPSRPGLESETNGSTPALSNLNHVVLQRKPASEAVATDREVSVELIPYAGTPGQVDTVAQSTAAASVVKVSFSVSVGPAYRGLQARYFEERSHHD